MYLFECFQGTQLCSRTGAKTTTTTVDVKTHIQHRERNYTPA